jgi:hypothetical protein
MEILVFMENQETRKILSWKSEKQLRKLIEFISWYF